MKKIITKVLLGLIAILLVGFLIPEKAVIPVVGASENDWNHQSFWYEPWGSSGVHKGIDIFAKKGTDLVSSTTGVVLFHGSLEKGGEVVLVLGPKWRLHYYAHLDSVDVGFLSLVSQIKKIGTVGDTGNAKGKQPHVHYSILTLFPYPWEMTSESQGWKKMLFIDPSEYLLDR